MRDSRNSNVLRFPQGQSGGLGLKFFAVLFYAYLAVMLVQVMRLSEGTITFLLVLGLAYNYGVRQRPSGNTYLRKNGLLLLILLVLATIVIPVPMISILLMAGIYWLLVGRSGREAPYFLRFHLLTALILNFFILLPYQILQAVWVLVVQVIRVGGLESSVSAVLPSVSEGLFLLGFGLIAGAALWLSLAALMGRTPYIGLVTPNVRHWS